MVAGMAENVGVRERAGRARGDGFGSRIPIGSRGVGISRDRGVPSKRMEGSRDGCVSIAARIEWSLRAGIRNRTMFASGGTTTIWNRSGMKSSPIIWDLPVGSFRDLLSR
jgi:hypothetical protein